MAGKTDKYRQTLEQMARDYLFPVMTPEERLRGLKPEDVVRALTPEEIVRALTPEEILRGLSPETREKLRQLLNGQGKQPRSQDQG